MFSFHADFLARMDDAGIDPVVLVEIDSNTSWYFSSRPLTSGMGASYADYEPVIANLSPVEWELPTGRIGVALISDISLVLQNIDTDLVAAILTTSLTNDTLEEKTFVVKVGFMLKTTGSAYSIANFNTIYEGKIRDYTWTEQELTIVAYDERGTTNPPIPRYKHDEDDSDCHEDIQGEYIPILYGDAQHALAVQANTALGAQSFTCNAQGGLGNIGLAATTVANIDVKVWDDGSKKWLTVAHTDDEGVSGAEEYTWGSTGIDFDDAANPNAELGNVLFVYEIHPIETVTSGDVTNPDNVWDDNTATYALFETDNDGPSNGAPYTFLAGYIEFGGYEGGVAATYRLPAFRQTRGNFLHVYVLLKADSVPAWLIDTETPDIRYAFVCCTPNPNTWGYFGGLESRGEMFRIVSPSYNNIDGTDDVNDHDLVGIFAGTPVPGSGYGGANSRFGQTGLATLSGAYIMVGSMYYRYAREDHDFNCYEVYLLVSTVINFEEIPRLCLEIQGRHYSTTWDARKTGTDPIERGVDIFEGMLRHELGLTGSEIDTSRFDTAYTTSGAYMKGVLSLYESEDWLEIKARMCEGLAARSWREIAGKEAIYVQPSAPSSDADLTEDHIIFESMDVKKTPLDECYNEWIVRYNWQPIADRWGGERYVNASDNNFTTLTTQGNAAETLCSSSVTILGHTRIKVIENRFVDTSAHAERLLDRMINRELRPFRHWVATFRTMYDEAFGLELCDIITIDHPAIPTALQGATHYWEVTRVAYDCLNAELEIEAVSLEADD